MSRIHGFLGGILLTASLTYYTGQYIEKNQRFISSQLQSANNVVENRILSDRGIERPIAIDKNITVSTRPFGETAKDIWNDEIITMANWIYSINWYSWGIETDKAISDLTNKVAETIVGEARK